MVSAVGLDAEVLVSKEALGILKRVTDQKSNKEIRLTDLLKDPYAETAEGWFMCVPPFFNDALDLKQTERVKKKEKILVWTQGSSFSFGIGDVLYDTPNANKVWSEAIKSLNLCVQVETASSAGPIEGEARRFAGSVTFRILTPNKDRSKLIERGKHTMSQDDFVRFLIAGPPEELKKEIERPR